MTNRVLLGNRNGTMGMWVSKPGFDVITAADSQMMMIANKKAIQVIQKGLIDTTGQAWPYTVYFPDISGYGPLVKWEPSGYSAYLQTLTSSYMQFVKGVGDNGVAGPKFISYTVFSLRYF